MEKCVFVDGTRLLGVLQQRLDFGGKRKATVVAAVIERLDAQSIADQPQLPRACVPQGDGEHAPEVLDAVDAPALESSEDHLGVRMIGLPWIATVAVQMGTNVGVIVDLAVEDDPESAVGTGHRLIRSAGKVDDRQPAMPQTDTAVTGNPDTGAVRARWIIVSRSR